MKKKFRAPRFKGIKENHSAIFITDNKYDPDLGRFRILTSTGVWKWFNKTDNIGIKTKIRTKQGSPCWNKNGISAVVYGGHYSGAIKDMRRYDEDVMVTYFLGYVKDTE